MGLRELRQNASELVRRVDAAEEFTMTVAGRPSARLIAAAELFDGPEDTAWDAGRDRIDPTLRDPWAAA